jgi:hypothetical protein
VNGARAAAEASRVALLKGSRGRCRSLEGKWSGKQKAVVFCQPPTIKGGLKKELELARENKANGTRSLLECRGGERGRQPCVGCCG